MIGFIGGGNMAEAIIKGIATKHAGNIMVSEPRDERRAYLERIFSVLLIGGILLFAGCAKKEKPAGFGNQEKLWQMATGQQKFVEPVELTYAKKTPALYRDASMGKADPSFTPKVTGG